MDAYRAIVDQRDQRAFLPRPISDEALGRILQAGRMAGSSKNREPKRFVVVRDAERRAAQNMMLAAWSLGTGSCPAHLPEADLAGLLGIPATVSINRVIGFGYVDPDRTAAPSSVAHRRRPLFELVHWETWSPST